MNFKNETIYLKAKQLREMITKTVSSAYFESSNYCAMLDELSLQIPLKIGMSLSVRSAESVSDHLQDAKIKLIELYTAVDLSTSEYFKIDTEKLEILVNEIFELIPGIIEKAEEEEKKWRDEIMKEFMVDENDGVTK